MTAFGDALRAFRQASNDPDRLNKRLSQERLGRLIGEEMGDLGFTGTAVAFWESGESKISAEDRKVLIALIQVLHRCGGLKTITEANRLLELGNYRALDEDEMRKIFGKFTSSSSLLFLLENLFFISAEELRMLITKARQEGPEPWWPRALAALMRKATDRFSLSLKTVLWVWVWLIAWWLIAPSLRLSFANENEMLWAMQKYVVGSLIIPLMIGLLTNTKDNEYWRLQADANPMLLRLYTYQGAGIGFNLGYFFIFPFSLLQYYLHIEPGAWIGILAATASLVLGNMGAWVVPHNLWRAFGRLTWSDGGIFFVAALMGPLWAFFFLEFYPILLDPVTGAVVFLLAITILVVMATRKSKNHDK